ncbi:branched-chain amino acid transport system permease protein [Defluviimonas denitrificans]|jgi:branched-chain amino acid transport system permease protein|uniref:Branched-chain amino acid transport system permease protein n=1 Tax=Albidovulum denitrificans TaxID=404881 RepID=A0A2S8S8W2_9RHOB|nr:ATP-binding cassette domain-containing protein [Defluviimonas denitrificans]PQV57232.1 branched-chain amino acid transport system permease protein [Defluviimonas denitrificans]
MTAQSALAQDLLAHTGRFTDKKFDWNAMLRAARQARAQIIAAAAEKLGCPADDLNLADGMIRSATNADVAALSGWLYAHVNRFVSPAPFSLHAGIEYMFMMVVGGMGQLVGAVAGAGVVLALKNLLQDILPLVSDHAAQIQSVVFAGLFIVLLQHARGGALSLLQKVRPGSMRHGHADIPATAMTAPLPRRNALGKGAALLTVDGVVKRFKGLVAVNEVSFDIRAGEMVGLIGPNGAGKSTMFNLMTGTLELSAGRVEFLG